MCVYVCMCVYGYIYVYILYNKHNESDATTDSSVNLDPSRRLTRIVIHYRKKFIVEAIFVQNCSTRIIE